ncbi:hypothetical protein SAMN06273572_11246 [Monaibacterium marinum]|uniref:Uncharacterized protein n=1 Tax=Pontivivens marinum TaxID=1690039 RepID=A0A2C9CWA4_9RHOB|nr:hypothetical protein SAMN06273572_11246 [Monaibacterium marinum]
MVTPAPVAQGQLTVAGANLLVPLENSLFAFDEAMPTILADHVGLSTVVAQTRGEGAAMQDLCQSSDSRPDIVLLTRSPQMVEIRQCEARGVDISADLVALYGGGLHGAPDSAQVWVAFVPDQLVVNPAAERAVRVLRYDFAGLIEGTVYEPYFTARRN